MTPELSAEQRLALHQLQTGEPLRVVDRETNTAYVLVPLDVYDKLNESATGDDPRVAYPLVDAAMHDDDAHDPILASYQSITRLANQP